MHPRADVPDAHEGIEHVQYSPTSLRIYTLGRFRVLLPEDAGGDEVAWNNVQSQTLLKCLLAAPGQQLTNEQVIDLLWPVSDPERGRERLRDTLSKLRRTLEPGRRAYELSTYVVSDRQSLRLHINSPTPNKPDAWLDADAFERLANAALASLEEGRDSRRGRSLADAALALYRGPFLPMERYADWSTVARQSHQRLWTALLRRLAYTEVAGRNLDRATLLLGKLTDVMPDDEDAIFLTMTVYAAAGRRAEALRIYQDLQKQLLSSLGSTPMLSCRH